MHLVGFIIGIYHDARSSECQICLDTAYPVHLDFKPRLLTPTNPHLTHSTQSCIAATGDTSHRKYIIQGQDTPVPVAVRSKAWVYGRSPAEIVVRIPLGACMSVSCECCVLSRRGLCDGLITRPEESYRLWCTAECDLETSRMRRPWPNGGCRVRRRRRRRYITNRKQI